jgi:uncharacterized protein with beta-barrel porin domain
VPVVLAASITVAAALPALAQATMGGDGGRSASSGGTSSATVGGDGGTSSPFGGGGGGGAGTLGGNGGDAGGGASPGGAGGLSPGEQGTGGQNGSGGNGGGGGGGGAHGGLVTTDTTSSGAITGGNGGRGGNSNASNLGAGGGGAGGYAVVVDGSGLVYTNSSVIGAGNGGAGGAETGSSGFGGKGGDGGYGMFLTGPGTVNNAGSITGGNGGNGGNATIGISATGGDGANGGAGIFFSGASTLNNSGSITGGNGGGGGNGGSTPTQGVAGIASAGLIGGDLTIVNSGSISGGLNFDGTRANAIRFTDGANTLTLQSGWSLTGNIDVTGSLTFNQSIAATLSNVIGGSGAIIQSGTGTLTLSGTSTYTGTTTVNGGTLAVNGSILASSGVTVNAGGTLAGTGIVGNTLISGGTFAPGSGTAGSSTTVTGTLGFNAAATYLVNVNPSTASFTNVSGVATLGGATVNAIFAPGSYISKQYTILNAGSISGTFGTLTNTNLPSNLTDNLSYDATHAFLNLTLSFTPGPTAPDFGNGLSGNQNNVGNALINYFNTTGGIPAVFASLNANGLSQASGQPGASTLQTGFAATGQFVNAVFDSAIGDGPRQGGAAGFAQDDDEASAYAPKRKVSREAKDAYAAVTPRERLAPSFGSRWIVWASVYGGNNRVNGDVTAGTNTTTSRIFGTVAGASYRFTPDTQAGFALGGAGSSFDIANGLGAGRAEVFNAAAYAKHTMGAAYVAGLLGYSWQDNSTDRTVSGTDTLHASFKAQALATRLEGGWRYATPWAGVTPYAAVQTTTFYLPGYAETATSGSDTFALSYESQTTTNVRTELGARADKVFLVSDGLFSLRGRLAWAHDSNTDRAVTPTFQTLPGATFTINGAQPSPDSALATAGAEMTWRNGFSLAATFEGEFSDTTQSYAGRGTMRYTW